MAYHVDEFLDTWTKKRNFNYGPSGFMEAFKADFGIHTDVCSVQRPCESLQSCDLQGDPDSQGALLHRIHGANLMLYER